MPGVGKTTIGKNLSKMLDVKHIDTDNLIESNQSSSINDIISNEGEEIFRALEKECLRHCLQTEKIAVVSTGGGIILDPDNRKIIKDMSCAIHIKCNLGEIVSRLEFSNRKLLYSTNKKEKLNSLWSERSVWYKSASHKEVDVSGLSQLDSTRKIYEEIK